MNGYASREKGRWDPAFVLGLMVAGAVLRLVALRGTGLWMDESNSVLIAWEPFRGIVDRLRLDSSPTLYYLLLHGWFGVFGASPLAVKSFSVLCGVLLIPAVYFLGRETAGRRAGLAGALLVSVHPLAVYYSREVRMYSLLVLLAVLLFISALRYLRSGSRRALAAMVLFTAAAVHTHNHGLFLWATAAILWWIVPKRSGRLVEWVAAHAVVGLSYLPWVPILAAQIRNPTHYRWLTSFWEAGPPAAVLFRSAEALVPGGAWPIYTDLRTPAWTHGWPAVLALAAALLAVLPGRRGVPAREASSGRAGAVLGTLFLFPLLLAWVYSFLFRPVYAVARTDLIALPAFLLLLVTGVEKVRFRPLRLTALGLFLLLSAVSLVPYLASGRRTGDRDIARHAAALTRPGDIVVATGLTRASTEYYFRLWGEDRELLSFPEEVARHPGSLDEETLLERPDLLAAEARRTAVRIATALLQGRACVVLRSPMKVNRCFWEELERKFDLRQTDPPGGFRQAVTDAPVNAAWVALPGPGGPARGPQPGPPDVTPSPE